MFCSIFFDEDYITSKLLSPTEDYFSIVAVTTCSQCTKTYKPVCFQNKENKQLRRIVNMVEFVNSDSLKDA